MGRHQNAVDAYLLHQGENFRAYEYLGAHRRVSVGYVFRVWASNAEAVELVGDFCGWETGIPMSRVTEGGIWEVKLPAGAVSVGDKYKYRIRAKNGELLWRQDPYSFECERLPADASVICDIDGYAWRDSGYISYRKGSVGKGDISIYGVDLSSWLRGSSGEVLGYEHIAEELAPYVKQLGCTHIALTGIGEYLRSASGCAPCSYFAPDSRLGTPLQFKGFIDRMHEAGVGVMFDFDISAFPACALGRFDGGALYEYSDSSPHFDPSRAEVECFLLSALTFWLGEYHMDGLLVSGILKLLGDRAGAISTGGAVAWSALLKRLCEYVHSEFPDVHLLATEDGLRGCRGLSWLEDSGLDTLGHVLQSNGEDMSLARQRAQLAHKLTFKGHKLIFMGTEIGQAEVNCRRHGVDWRLLESNGNAGLQQCAAELGHLCLASEALRAGETEEFRCETSQLLYYTRKKGDERLLALVNYSDKNFEKISLPVPFSGIYREMFNSDSTHYGGNGRTNSEPIASESGGVGNYKYSITVSIPPLATILFRVKPKNARTKKHIRRTLC